MCGNVVSGKDRLGVLDDMRSYSSVRGEVS